MQVSRLVPYPAVAPIPVSTPGHSGARKSGSCRTRRAAPPRIACASSSLDARQRYQSGAARVRCAPAWTPEDDYQHLMRHLPAATHLRRQRSRLIAPCAWECVRNASLYSPRLNIWSIKTRGMAPPFRIMWDFRKG